MTISTSNNVLILIIDCSFYQCWYSANK
jgi:hypothetical protein